jgi:hypothetical protein
VIGEDLSRVAVVALIGLGACVFFLIQGLSRSGGRGVLYLLLGVLMGGCVVLMAGGVVRVWRQERGLPAEERVAARAARLERAERSRPAWLKSVALVVLLFASAAYWAYLSVVALMRGFYAFGALDALIFVACLWTATRIVRRRHRRTGS